MSTFIASRAPHRVPVRRVPMPGWGALRPTRIRCAGEAHTSGREGARSDWSGPRNALPINDGRYCFLKVERETRGRATEQRNAVATVDQTNGRAARRTAG